MKLYIVSLFTVLGLLFLRYIFLERPVCSISKRRSNYFHHSNFNKEDRILANKYKWNTRRIELSVDIRQILKPLVNETEVNNRTSKEVNVSSSPEEDEEVKKELEFEGKAREDTFNISSPKHHPHSVLLLMYSREDKMIGIYNYTRTKGVKVDRESNSFRNMRS